MTWPGAALRALAAARSMRCRACDRLASAAILQRLWTDPCTTPPARSYSKVSVFDSTLKLEHRERVARLGRYDDRLQNEIAHRLVDRLLDCTRTFESVLVVGGAGLVVARKLVEEASGDRGGIRSVTYAESSPSLRAAFDAKAAFELASSGVAFDSVALSDPDESTLAEVLASGRTFDAAISCLGLHWVNDLPGCLASIRRCLKPDGLFLGGFLGGDTLQEMRIACSVAEMEREGGVSPRTSPLARVRDAGSLLSAASFGLPVVDVDTISIRYPTASHVVDHLRRMGEQGANSSRRGFLGRDSALAAAAAYQALFQEEDGTVPSTYQVIYVSGWSPHESQQRPSKRGAANASFRDLKQEIKGQGGGGEAEKKGDSS